MKSLILIFLAIVTGFFFSCNNSKKVAGGDKMQIKLGNDKNARILYKIDQ